MRLLVSSVIRLAIYTTVLSLVDTAIATYAATTNFTEWYNVTDFPNEQAANVSRYVYEALKTAGKDLYPFFEHRCIRSQIYDKLGDLAQADGFVQPTQPFDSVFFVGSSYVSSWAIDTGAGLVLIDTQDNPQEAARVVLSGLEYFGYNGSEIAAVIITHEHADHYGGARFLQDTFGMPIYASSVAWDTMADDPIAPQGLVPPERNITIEDGQDLTIGNTTFSFIATPGHTPGTVSFFFNVYDHGSPHVAAIYGGGGVPSNASAKEEQIGSYEKFSNHAILRGADTLIANHQTQDKSLYNFDLLRHRPCGPSNCDEANPFVIGDEAYLRYLKTMALCVRVQAAREGQILSL
ncbi:beta-lactamase-like protein [Truncatella angustata]|uniref:Beta-lactamase-like protein n=1 Tax=Truncatella angustata TaxID=152316 RepID=A0A9P8UF74_9PEZI|nr:beta-lactamase-like protein [Truncatella angustata]KAH6648821.1 beta-lactamase-like protein [Truncatella angustata]KAH8200884.1 hypothetical protein TruAng_004970 [Truncatella angustata]